MHKTWLLKLTLPGRYGRFLTGLLVLALLLPFFYLGAAEERHDGTPALFFSAIIAYIVPMFSFITSKAAAEIGPELYSFSRSQEHIRAGNRLFQQSAVRADYVEWAAVLPCQFINSGIGAI